MNKKMFMGAMLLSFGLIKNIQASSYDQEVVQLYYYRAARGNQEIIERQRQAMLQEQPDAFVIYVERKNLMNDEWNNVFWRVMEKIGPCALILQEVSSEEMQQWQEDAFKANVTEEKKKKWMDEALQALRNAHQNK